MTLADDWLQLLATALVMAIGAIGLNLVTGYAGQVSLGHAFFVGVGAYTAAVVSGDPGGPVYGLGVTSLPAWLIAAGSGCCCRRCHPCAASDAPARPLSGHRHPRPGLHR